MRDTMENHLTDEQFADHAIGEELAPEVRAHLAACSKCRAEIEGFGSALRGFEAVTAEWSNSQPKVSFKASRHGKIWSVPAVPRWALAGLAVIVVGATTTHYLSRPSNRPSSGSAIAVSADSEAQIAQDDKLMEAVNLALTQPEPSPFSEYGLTDQPGKRSRASAKMRSQ